MSKPLSIAIIGASGYTGAELVRLLLNHPHVKIKALVAGSNAGNKLRDVYPHLDFAGLPDLISLDALSYDGIDVAFCCLPHGTTQAVVKNIPQHVKVIDLSADFRLNNAKTYQEWYGHPHQAIELQEEAVYGLTEMYRGEIKKARLVACPGCYPTSASLPLVPLLKKELIDTDNIIIDAKSGISGAGRSAKVDNLFCERNDSMQAYSISKHRHVPEIEQTLSQAAGEDTTVQFTPQVVPMNRGILSTIYVRAEAPLTTLRKALEDAYKNEPFVHIAPEGHTPSTREVLGTNRCIINLFQGREASRVVIVSVIDNLVKGAAGQAIQNMNVMMGFAETTGLTGVAVFP